MSKTWLIGAAFVLTAFANSAVGATEGSASAATTTQAVTAEAGTATATDAGSAPATTTTTTGTEQKVSSQEDSNRIVCRSEPARTGSHMSGRTCKTAAQWKMSEGMSKETIRDMHINSGMAHGNGGGN